MAIVKKLGLKRHPLGLLFGRVVVQVATGRTPQHLAHSTLPIASARGVSKILTLVTKVMLVPSKLPDHSQVRVQIRSERLIIEIPGDSLDELFTLPGLLLLIATTVCLILPLISRIGMGIVIFMVLSICFSIYLEALPTFIEFSYRRFRKGKIIRGRKFSLVGGFISDIEAIYRSEYHIKGSKSFSWVLKLKTVTRESDVDFGMGLLNREEIDYLIEVIHHWLSDFCGIQLENHNS